MHTIFRHIVGLLMLVAATSCTVVDEFGNRATMYNMEAAKARTQGVLLNVLRSAFRKPLQFIDIPTVSGQGSISGGLGSIIPLAGPASAYQINPSAMLSGGPTFNVSSLNTKEFYSGVLSPLPMEIISYYMHTGYPSKLLLTLFLQRISIAHGTDHKTYRNYFRDSSDVKTPQPAVDDRGYFGEFQILLGELIDAGLTTRTITETRNVGPALPVGTQTGASIANLHKEGLDVVASGGRSYQVVKKTDKVIFCFDHLSQGGHYLSATVIREHQCGNSKARRSAETGTDSLQFFPRSTEGVIYFLGEIARLEFGWTNLPPFVPTIQINGESDVFFALRRGASDPSLTVTYEGATYSVGADPRGRDHSSQILDIVLQLLALNSASKDLPAPNVITIGR